MRGVAGLVVRWGITAGAVAVAAWAVPGITVSGPHPVWSVLVVALVLGFVNAWLRPILSFLSCGLIVLTLGLFTLIINGFMLWIASLVTERWLGLGFHVEGFWNAVLGSVIISVVSFLASVFVGGKRPT
jgi:putative membrane protein